MKRAEPKPGQESVWDYPRPPRCESLSKSVEVFVDDICIASSNQAVRVLETSHPPTIYIPPIDVDQAYFHRTLHQTFCEWKGIATYFDITHEQRRIANGAWSYPTPSKAFECIRDHFAFYPSRVDACYIDGERVQAQAGDFYGGWITSNIVGPFKGGPGTRGW